jgi:glycosyltransferase involved in cell wall biosynthesis
LRLAFVVQRYGPEATGGAEGHCRALAQRLARDHDVRVLTSCARDYAEWRNHYPPGDERVDGLRVTRFAVTQPRSKREFALWSDIVLRDHHTREDEHEWVRQNGPQVPALVAALSGLSEIDAFVFYSYRYYPTFFGLPRVAERAVLVPTAEDDAVLGLAALRELLAQPRGLLYLTPEEQQLVESAAANAHLPSAVVGCGIDVADGWQAVDVRARFGLDGPYLLYLGRLDAAKGVDRLLDYYERFAARRPDAPRLVLAGSSVLDLPRHPKLRYLGVVGEADKFALLAGCELLLLPSALESLSLSVLEAWAMGRPVLVNAACRVLEGQCLRANGGLFYHGYAEFEPALERLLAAPELRAALGRCGRDYVSREYAWDVVEGRTRRLLERVVNLPGREEG